MSEVRIARIKKRKNPFVQIDKTCLDDVSLSWKAKGLHAYLISKPDDWVVRLTQLCKASTEGRDAMRTGITELEKAGYIKKGEKPEHDEKGRLIGCAWYVYELPQPKSDYPNSAEPQSDNTAVGQSASTNKELRTKNEVNNTSSPPSKPLALEGESSSAPILINEKAPPSTLAPANCEVAPQAPILPCPLSAPAKQGDSGAGAKPGPRKVTWLTPLNDIHIRILGGPIKNFGQAARDFKPLIEKYSLELVCKGWEAHCKAEGKYASSSHFASKPLVWMPSLKPAVSHVDVSQPLF